MIDSRINSLDGQHIFFLQCSHPLHAGRDGLTLDQVSHVDQSTAVANLIGRLYSYWRFQEREGGAHVECRAISLTRDVPLGLGWIMQPIIQKLPKESLINTLEATRQALLAQTK